MCTACIFGFIAIIGYAEDSPIDARAIYDKLDTKIYERVLLSDERDTVITAVSEYSATDTLVLISTETNITTVKTTETQGLNPTNAVSIQSRSRLWTIRGTPFSNLIYLRTIDKDGKRLVCLSPPGLGVMTIPIEDLGADDIRTVEEFERASETLKQK